MQLAGSALRSYFGSSRGRQNRGRARRGRARRHAGLSRSRANVRTSLPTRSIMQGSFTGSIRQYFTVKSTTQFYKTFTPADLIGDRYASLAAQFTEVRFNACRLYFYPDSGTGAAFSYAACLFDDTSASSSTTPTFGEILASPGSVCRRGWQTCGLHWKWTEPSDAEFRSISGTVDKLFIFQLATNNTITIAGELVCDCSIILRNQTGSVATTLRRHIELLSGNGFSPEDWNMVLTAFKSLKRRLPPHDALAQMELESDSD